jgi:ComF family protein
MQKVGALLVLKESRAGRFLLRRSELIFYLGRMGLRPLLRETLYGAVHMLFPQLCEGCRAPLLYQEKVLCMSCAFELPQTAFHDRADNEAALRIAGRIPYQNATSFAYFTAEGLLQHLLHRLKYSGRKTVGVYLGEQAGHSLKSASWIKDVEAISPVPLHHRKEAGRGYNQSAAIAAGLSRVLNIPVHENALVRTRHTESQTKMSREERISNVKDAFRLHPKVQLQNHHVLLVDDVLTTGATVEAASDALLHVPGLKLSICTIGLAKD